MTNLHFKDMIATHFSKLETILADPECKFTGQLRINFDLIKVSDGWCWSTSKREFVQNPIKEIGKESPRTFVHYHHNKSPNAKYFKEILEKQFKSN